jgi:hypothetical protein
MTNICDFCGHPDAHDPLCPNREEHSRIVIAIEPSKEICEAGTRAELDALRAQVEVQEKELAHWKVREKQWHGVADLGKSVEKVKAENSRRWHEKNTARIDELETARDLALAKAESYKRSRDDWMRRFRLRAGRTIELRRENKQLRDALNDLIECAEVSADFDMLCASDEIQPGGYDINPAYQVLENARALVENAPIPFESDDESDHAPDGLEPLSAEICARCGGMGQVSRMAPGVGMWWERCECSAESAANNVPSEND